MKTIKFSLALMFVAASVVGFSGCAFSEQTVESHIEVSAKEKAKYFKQGYEKGYKQGYEKGYKESFLFYLTNLKKWERDILALEVGKHLVKKGLVKPPRIYRVVAAGGGEVKVRGGEVSLSAIDKILESGIYIPEWHPIESPAATTAQEELNLSYETFTPINPLQKIYYDKGFINGYQKGYVDGRKKAKSEIKTFIEKKYGKKILREEVEKYLSDKTFITVPRVYSIATADGGMRIVTIPPRIEPLRTIDDILDGKFIPIPDFNAEETESDYGSGYRMPKLVENSFSENGEDTPEIIKVKVPKYALRVLEKLAIPYLQMGDEYYAVFFDRGQKESFCRKYRLCR